MAQQLWLPSYYRTGMVLQQQMPVIISGRTASGQEVHVRLTRQPHDNRPVSPQDKMYGEIIDAAVTADDQGNFTYELPAFKASFDNFTISVSAGRSRRVIDNILFGEVWIAAGQSNMQMPLSRTRDKDKAQELACLPYLRVLRQKETGLTRKKDQYSYSPCGDLSGAEWLRGDDPDSMRDVSAIALSFARALMLDLKLPVGIVETALGGTHIHSWLARDTVEEAPELLDHVKKLGFYRSKKDWNLNSDPLWACHQPAALYNHKVAPLKGYSARGVLWYQGESDYAYPEIYQKFLKALVADWQKIIRPADSRGLAWLMVQLAPYFYGHKEHTRLARFNEMLAAVRRQLPVPSGIVPVYDLLPTYDAAPEDWRHPIHPDSKLPIGERLKTIALGLLYERKAPSSAPECKDIEIIDNKMMLSFENIGEGLRLPGDATTPRGFSICGPDRVFVEAEARLLYGVRVLVWHDQVQDPRAVAYAYSDMNLDANLVSRDHLPLVPFRSDRESAEFLPPQIWTRCDDIKIWACPRMDDLFSTGSHPVWSILCGDARIRVEKANKSEGEGSLHIRYRTQADNLFQISPVLDYDSLYPPFDWSFFQTLTVDIFNADRHMKFLKLQIVTGDKGSSEFTLDASGPVLAALRWQTYKFDLSRIKERHEVRRVIFSVSDKKGGGEIYMDNVRLRLPERS